VKGGTAQCGLLVRKGSKSDKVLDLRGKVDTIEHARIFDSSSALVDTNLSRNEMVRTLQKIDRERNRLTATIDVFELWEVVQPECREWTLDELVDLYFVGEPGPHGRAALFRALIEGHTFHRRNLTFEAVKTERVAEYRAQEQREAATDRWLRQAADWLRSVAKGAEKQPPHDADRAIELLAGKVLFGKDCPHAAQATKITKLAHFHTREAMFDVLVKLGRWSEHENLDLLRHDVPIEFDDETTNEAKTAHASPAAASRLWMQRVYSFSGDTGDHERAVSIRQGMSGIVVRVHLASPALFMNPAGCVQRSAAERGTRLQLPDRAIPLVPKAITDKAALTADDVRPCLSLRMRFDRRFKLKDYRFEVRRVRVSASLSIAEANARVHRDRGLSKLRNLANHLRQQRLRAGAVILSEPRIDIDAKGDKPSLSRFEPNDPVRMIEEELAILTNALSGQFCTDRGLPAVYQARDACGQNLVEPGRFDPVAVYRQKRVMPKAVLQTEPAAHRGLGIEACAPLNRPFERYTDLLMHQQIVGFLSNGRTAHSEDDLRQALLYTASARTTNHEIEAVARRYWLLRYLEAWMDRRLDATVLERWARGFLVELHETRLWAFCPIRSGLGPHPGTRLRIKLTHVSARTNDVRMQLADP
jgi:exoribonuclease-2